MFRNRFLIALLALVIAWCVWPARPVAAQNPPQTQTASGNVFPELAGQLGGPVFAVAQQSHYACIGVGPRLVVVDVSTPAHPAAVGQTDPLSDTIRGIAVAGDYAYVAAGDSGLYLVNIANPAAPVQTGFYNTPGFAWSVVVSGTYAYVADEDSLQIINVADPFAPVGAGSFNNLSYAQGVATAGNYVYVAEGYNGLRVINVADPKFPTRAGTYDTYDTLGWAGGVAVAGNLAYVASGVGGLYIVDIANPIITPTLVVSYQTPAPAQAVAVAGDYAYVATVDEKHKQGGLHIINIATPDAPVEAGFYESYSGVESVTPAGGYAYLATGYGGLRLVNIANPAQPVEAGSYNSPDYAQSAVVLGDYAYITELNGLRLVNIANPANPVETGFYYDPGYTYTWNVAITATYAYLAAGVDGVRIVDVADPQLPVEAGVYKTPGQVQDVAIKGNYAYLVGEGGLRVLNIANPVAPVQAGVYSNLYYPQSVAVAGNYVYVVEAGGLRIINIANPSTPVEEAFYNPEAMANAGRVVVAGDYAYVAAGASGLLIINIANPAVPVQVGFYNTADAALGVTVAGNYAFVADAGAGLRVINIANPSAPVEAGFYDTPGLAQNVVVVGNHAYVADGDGGLITFNLLTDKVTGLVPPEGLSISSTNGRTVFTFPANTFTQTVRLVYRQLLFDEHADARLSLGHPFELSAVYSDTGQITAPGQTFSLTLHYTEAEKGPVMADTLSFYYWVDPVWVKEPTAVNTSGYTLIATPNHLSLWTVLGQTQRLYLPLIHKQQDPD